MANKDHRQYVRVAVDLPSNRKVLGLNVGAKWLHVTALCWCGQNLTDGEFPPAVAVALAGVPQKHVRELVHADLWHEKGHHCADCPQPERVGELVIHHYGKHQESAEKVREKAVARSLAGRKANHTRWGHEGRYETCGECS